METPMSLKQPVFSFALVVAAIAASPVAAQTNAVDDQFCGRRNITEVAAKLTRDWSERFQQNIVEQVVENGWTASGKVVEASNVGVICRISFSNIDTSNIPARRIAINDLDFRYSESGGQAQLVPLSLPLSGFDQRSALLAVWEKTFINERSSRSIVEEKVEHNPQLAADLGELIGRPKGTENTKWEPDQYCTAIGAAGAGSSIIHWAEKNNLVRYTGLTSKETPSWLPPADWKVANLKAVSSIPFQSVICTADVSYTANKFDGSRIPMEIRGMSYKVWGSDDGSRIYFQLHNWPNEQQSQSDDNAFVRAFVINGVTTEMVVASKKQREAGQPKNVIEALGQQQAAYNKQIEAYAKSQGIDIDAMKRA
jgi:hypothetical protein